jgi:nucleotide-binding universal stress UspA family protein
MFVVGSAGDLMRVLVWIVESGWEACIDHAATLPDDADIVLLHVASSDAEDLAERGAARRFGRRVPQPDPADSYRALAEAEAQQLLTDARTRLGRDAELVARRGKPEREVVAAAAAADLLITVRDGELKLGPKSLARHARFVVDHAPCPVLLVWRHAPPDIETIPPPPAHPPHPPEHRPPAP